MLFALIFFLIGWFTTTEVYSAGEKFLEDYYSYEVLNKLSPQEFWAIINSKELEDMQLENNTDNNNNEDVLKKVLIPTHLKVLPFFELPQNTHFYGICRPPKHGTLFQCLTSSIICSSKHLDIYIYEPNSTPICFTLLYQIYDLTSHNMFKEKCTNGEFDSTVLNLLKSPDYLSIQSYRQNKHGRLISLIILGTKNQYLGDMFPVWHTQETEKRQKELELLLRYK